MDRVGTSTSSSPPILFEMPPPFLLRHLWKTASLLRRFFCSCVNVPDCKLLEIEEIDADPYADFTRGSSSHGWYMTSSLHLPRGSRASQRDGTGGSRTATSSVSEMCPLESRTACSKERSSEARSGTEQS